MADFFKKYQEYIIFTALFLVAFFLKFASLGVRDLAMDEPFTLFHSQKSLADIIALSSQGEPHPPLFMMLVHLWNKVANYDVATLRMLSLFFHALTAPALFFTGKRFFGLWSGILASGLFLLSSQFFYFATELRGYGLFCFLAISALYFFLASTEKPSFKNLALLVVFNVLLIYNHYFAFLLLATQGICSLFYLKNKRVFLRFLAVFGATLILFLPLAPALISQFFQSSEGTWVPKPRAIDYIFQMRNFLNGGDNCIIGRTLLALGVIIAIIRGRFLRLEKKFWITLIWWIVPYTLMYFLSEKLPMFLDRYLLFNAMGVYLFAGAALKNLARLKWLKILLAAVLLLLMGRHYTNNQKYNKRELKQAIDFIKQEKDDHTIIGIYPKWVQLHFSFHYDLESFKTVENLEEELEKHNILSSWGTKEYKELAKKINADKIIFFTTNGFSDKTRIIEEMKKTFPNREDHKFELDVMAVILSK